MMYKIMTLHLSAFSWCCKNENWDLEGKGKTIRVWCKLISFAGCHFYTDNRLYSVISMLGKPHKNSSNPIGSRSFYKLNHTMSRCTCFQHVCVVVLISILLDLMAIKYDLIFVFTNGIYYLNFLSIFTNKSLTIYMVFSIQSLHFRLIYFIQKKNQLK